MVLSSSTPHDKPPSSEARWLHELRLSLKLSKAAILLNVDRAQPARLGELVRALSESDPDLAVYDDVRAAATAPEGSTMVLLARGSDASWLNLERPLFARRALKVVLFCDHETTIELSRRAPDFFDWISKHEDCPDGPPLHAVLGLRAAFEADEPVVWTNPDIDGLWIAFSTAFPGQALRWITPPTREYGKMVLEIREAADACIGFRPGAAHPLRRFRWAMAEAGRRSRAIVVTHDLPCPGYWPVHNRLVPFVEARDVLANAGASRSGVLAALTGLEPEAVELARELLDRGTSESTIAALLRGATDPGAALAREALKARLLDLEAVSNRSAVPPALRGLAGEPKSKLLRVERLDAIKTKLTKGDGVASEDIALFATHRGLGAPPKRGPPLDLRESKGVFIVEALLRAGPTPEMWADLALRALEDSELAVASAWAQRSLEQSRRPPRTIRDVERLLSALDDERGAQLRYEIQRREVVVSGVEAILEPVGRAAMVTFKFVSGALVAIFTKTSLTRPLGLGIVYIYILVFITKGDVGSVLPYFWYAIVPTLLVMVFNLVKWLREDVLPQLSRPAAPVLDDKDWAKHNVDACYHDYQRGAYVEVEKNLRTMLRVWTHMGPEDSRYRATQNLHAFVLNELHEDKEALSELDKAIAIEGRVSGVEHKDFIGLILALSEVLTRTGRVAKADALLRKLLGADAVLPGEPENDAAPASGGSGSPSHETEEMLALFLAQPRPPKLPLEGRVRALRLLAQARLVQGRYEEAEALLERGLMLAEALPEHQERGRALGVLARILTLENRLEEARDALIRARSEMSATVGERHIHFAGTVRKLTRVEYHIDYVRIIHELARVEYRMGRPEAASTARHALQLYAQAECSEAERLDATLDLEPIARSQKNSDTTD